MSSIRCVCGKVYKLPPGLEGKIFRCKACNHKLQVPSGTSVDQKTPPAKNLRPHEVDQSLVGAQGTVAGNPGMLSFSRARFLSCYPAIVFLSLSMLVICPAAAVLEHTSVFIGVGLGIACAGLIPIYGTDRMKKKFHSGNLCAAKVINLNPYTVAVLTDLSTGRKGPKLAIGIRKQPLAKMTGGAPKQGDRLAAISFYIGRSTSDAWDDFMPTIINCGCKDEKQIQRALASIDPDDWQIIDQALPKLKSKNVGTYEI